MNNIILKCHVFFWNFLKHVFLAKKKVFALPARVPCLCVPPHDKKYAYSSVTAFIFTVSKIQMLYQV